MFRSFVIAVTIVLTFASSAHAQSGGRKLWTSVGAGAGFGVGTWIGFAKFDQATYAERKIWTCAITGAAIGGVGGYFIGRAQDRRRSSPKLTPAARQPRLDQRIVDELARSVRLMH